MFLILALLLILLLLSKGFQKLVVWVVVGVLLIIAYSVIMFHWHAAMNIIHNILR